MIFQRLDQILLPFMLVCPWHLLSQVHHSRYSDLYSNRSLEFSMITHKNKSGHWISSLSLEKSAAKLPQKWIMGFKTEVNSQEDKETFRLRWNLIVPPTKPSDYILHKGMGYYKVHQEAATFNEAYSTCLKERGHLAIINSKEEAIVLGSLIDGSHQVFIGYTDTEKEGEFRSIFGEPQTFAEWKYKQPDNHEGKENCGTIFSDGRMNDVSCDSKFQYICEFDLSWPDE